jgi:hypothetical protein
MANGPKGTADEGNLRRKDKRQQRIWSLKEIGTKTH